MTNKKHISNFKIDEEFLNNYESMDTRKTYSISLKFFFEYLYRFHPKVLELALIERNMIIQYRNILKDSQGPNGEFLTPNTISLRLAAISSYFEYLIEKGLLSSNPASSVKRPRQEVVTPTRALSVKQVRELFDSVESKQSGPLHLALIATLWLTGLRKSEVLNLKRKHYYDVNESKVLQFIAKGGKHKQKVVHKELEFILENYLDWMEKKSRKHNKEDWLFQPTKNPIDSQNLSKQINPRTLNRIIEKYSKKIGINFNVSPHSARATFISTLLEQGVPIVDVAKEVTHSSIKTTQIYDKRREELEKSPVHNLKY